MEINAKINKIQLHEEEELLNEALPLPIITTQIGNEQKLVKALMKIRGWIAIPSLKICLHNWNVLPCYPQMLS